MLEGVSSVAKLLTHFLIHSVFFVSKSNLFDIYSDEKTFEKFSLYESMLNK